MPGHKQIDIAKYVNSPDMIQHAKTLAESLREQDVRKKDIEESRSQKMEKMEPSTPFAYDVPSRYASYFSSSDREYKLTGLRNINDETMNHRFNQLWPDIIRRAFDILVERSGGSPENACFTISSYAFIAFTSWVELVNQALRHGNSEKGKKALADAASFWYRNHDTFSDRIVAPDRIKSDHIEAVIKTIEEECQASKLNQILGKLYQNKNDPGTAAPPVNVAIDHHNRRPVRIGRSGRDIHATIRCTEHNRRTGQTWATPHNETPMDPEKSGPIKITYIIGSEIVVVDVSSRSIYRNEIYNTHMNYIEKNEMSNAGSTSGSTGDTDDDHTGLPQTRFTLELTPELAISILNHVGLIDPKIEGHIERIVADGAEDPSPWRPHPVFVFAIRTGKPWNLATPRGIQAFSTMMRHYADHEHDKSKQHASIINGAIEYISFLNAVSHDPSNPTIEQQKNTLFKLIASNYKNFVNTMPQFGGSRPNWDDDSVYEDASAPDMMLLAVIARGEVLKPEGIQQDQSERLFFKSVRTALALKRLTNPEAELTREEWQGLIEAHNQELYALREADRIALSLIALKPDVSVEYARQIVKRGLPGDWYHAAVLAAIALNPKTAMQYSISTEEDWRRLAFVNINADPKQNEPVESRTRYFRRLCYKRAIARLALSNINQDPWLRLKYAVTNNYYYDITDLMKDYRSDATLDPKSTLRGLLRFGPRLPNAAAIFRFGQVFRGPRTKYSHLLDTSHTSSSFVLKTMAKPDPMQLMRLVQKPDAPEQSSESNIKSGLDQTERRGPAASEAASDDDHSYAEIAEMDHGESFGCAYALSPVYGHIMAMAFTVGRGWPEDLYQMFEQACPNSHINLVEEVNLFESSIKSGLESRSSSSAWRVEYERKLIRDAHIEDLKRQYESACVYVDRLITAASSHAEYEQDVKNDILIEHVGELDMIDYMIRKRPNKNANKNALSVKDTCMMTFKQKCSVFAKKLEWLLKHGNSAAPSDWGELGVEADKNLQQYINNDNNYEFRIGERTNSRTDSMAPRYIDTALLSTVKEAARKSRKVGILKLELKLGLLEKKPKRNKKLVGKHDGKKQPNFWRPKSHLVELAERKEEDSRRHRKQR